MRRNGGRVKNKCFSVASGETSDRVVRRGRRQGEYFTKDKEEANLAKRLDLGFSITSLYMFVGGLH